MIREAISALGMKEKLMLTEEVIGGVAMIAYIKMSLDPGGDTLPTYGIGVAGTVLLADGLRRIFTPVFKQTFSQPPQPPTPTAGP